MTDKPDPPLTPEAVQALATRLERIIAPDGYCRRCGVMLGHLSWCCQLEEARAALALLARLLAEREPLSRLRVLLKRIGHWEDIETPTEDQSEELILDIQTCLKSILENVAPAPPPTTGGTR